MSSCAGACYSVNPLMALVPQTALFLAHLLFGLVDGVVLAVTFRRCGDRPGRQSRAVRYGAVTMSRVGGA
jgi:hypothetical protein